MPASDLVTPTLEESPAGSSRGEAPAAGAPRDEPPAAEGSGEAPACGPPDEPHTGESASPPRPSREARREVIATLAIVGTILGMALARPLLRRLEPRPPVEQCAAMLAHYAEEQVRAIRLVRPLSSTEPTRPRASELPPAAGGARAALEIERCSRDLTAEEVDCAVHAGNVDEIERCLPLP